MALTRRDFLALSAAGILVGGAFPLEKVRSGGRPGFRAIAFDAFPIFDPRPILKTSEALFPGRGQEIMNAWRTRQFEYQWLRALGGQYVDFLQATEDGLEFASKQLQLDISREQRQRMMSPYLNLAVWPDAPDVIRALHRAGLRLVFLSNMTHSMLESGISRAGLTNFIEGILSTDQIKTYKPDPRAYQMAVDVLGLKREEILFVAFAGWDVAGAKWFGYPTFWVNRLGSPMEVLGVSPDGVGRDLHGLVDYLGLELDGN